MRARGDETSAAGGAGDAAARSAQSTGEPGHKEIDAVRDELMTARKRLLGGAGAAPCGVRATSAGRTTFVLAPSAARTTLLRAPCSGLPARACVDGAVGPDIVAPNRVRAVARVAA